MINALQPLLEKPGDCVTLVLSRDASNGYRATLLQKRTGVPDEHLPGISLHGASLEELQASFEGGLPNVAAARSTALEQIALAVKAQAAVSTKNGKAAPVEKPGPPTKTAAVAPKSSTPPAPVVNPRIAVLEAELMALRGKLDAIAKGSGLQSAFDAEDAVVPALRAMPMGNQYSRLQAELLTLAPAKAGVRTLSVTPAKSELPLEPQVQAQQTSENSRDQLDLEIDNANQDADEEDIADDDANDEPTDDDANDEPNDD